jgi:arylsulfatase
MRRGSPWQLFDMDSDRTEQQDLSRDIPDLATRLEAEWTDWSRRTFVDEWPGPDHTDWGQAR